jgi:hypothetical protein
VHDASGGLSLRGQLLSFIVRTFLLVVTTVAQSDHAFADELRISEADVARLKPGEFIWKPWLAPGGELKVVVDLRAQRASVYRAGTRIGASTISSGKRKYRTPTGVFRISAKYKVHRSKKYNNAPMPFAQRFTRDGVALHSGRVPGYPSSHGCVHLPRVFAEVLFDKTSLGTKVVVTSGNPAPEEPRSLMVADEAAGRDSPSTAGE